jgi:hypothetical protein
MQYVTRYHVRQDKAQGYRNWLLQNRETLEQQARDGWKYLGTWFTVQGFGTYAAETRWELTDYASLGSGFGDGAYRELLHEWFTYIDDSRDWYATLMKSTDDVDILD